MSPLIPTNIANHEGRRLRFYLDTRGIVTIGVGHAVFDAASAKTLKLYLTPTILATPDMIAQDWLLVHNRVIPQGRLFMLEADVDALLSIDLARFTAILRREFPELDTYPIPAQVALYDICYECGSIEPGAWPHLNASVHKRDWIACSKECFRGACGAERNADTVRQFIEAVEAATA